MMYLADENVPLQAIQALRAAGIDIAAISELMAGASDTDVMLRARLARPVLSRHGQPGAHDPDLFIPPHLEPTGLTATRRAKRVPLGIDRGIRERR
jgi:hypothetical protein